MNTFLNTTFSTLKYTTLALLVAFSVSCSPEDGEDGAPGKDGNANVIASDWFQIQFDHINTANDYAYMAINIPNYQEFVDNGGVAMVYLRQNLNGESIIHPLPYEDMLSFALANVPSEGVENSLVIFANGSDISDLETLTYINFKYVLIPGGVEAKNTIDYSKMSYEELITHFELED